MDWLRGSAAAVVIELVAWWLGLSWGFAVLVLAFVGMAVPVAAKARSTEKRVAAIMPVLAAHAANITTAQNTANNAQNTANTANGAANNAQGTANGASSTANEALSFINNGGTIGGNVQIDGNLFTSGSMNPSGPLNANGINAGGITASGITSNGDVHVNGNTFISGNDNCTQVWVSGSRIAPNQGAPGGYPIVNGTPFNNGTIGIINSIVSGLQQAGIFN